MSKYQVLGLGNALLDYQVEVSDEFLIKHQLKKGSMTLVDEAFQHKMIRDIEQALGREAIRMTSGGCSANTLAGFSNYGGKAYFVGKVSEDVQGKIYAEDMKKCGVEADLHIGSSDRTGTCLALITPDAERTMLTHLGIATHLAESNIDAQKISDSDIVYIEGYLWDPPSGRAASKKAMEIARAQKKKVAFTFSDSFCVDRHFEDFVSLAKTQIDILFCNETEALRATSSNNIDHACKMISEWSPYVFVTLGPNGAFISDRARKISEVIPTWDVKLVDKLGAGDLFAAGALYGMTHGKSLKESGYLGCYSATKVIQQMSARLSEDLHSQIPLALEGPDQSPKAFRTSATVA